VFEQLVERAFGWPLICEFFIQDQLLLVQPVYVRLIGCDNGWAVGLDDAVQQAFELPPRTEVSSLDFGRASRDASYLGCGWMQNTTSGESDTLVVLACCALPSQAFVQTEDVTKVGSLPIFDGMATRPPTLAVLEPTPVG